jgi:hypothetical protein
VVQVMPQVPQLALSVWRLAQYGTPELGMQVDSAPQVMAQTPLVQTWPLPQVMPQVPQLALSVWRLAQ